GPTLISVLGMAWLLVKKSPWRPQHTKGTRTRPPQHFQVAGTRRISERDLLPTRTTARPYRDREAMPRRHRSTPPGEHRPVLLDEVLHALDPRPGEVVVDCTLGWAGHAAELLGRVGPTGRLIGLDLDADNLPRARERLEAVGFPFELHRTNFAALPTVLGSVGLTGADVVLADLGMSSMQVDDAERG